MTVEQIAIRQEVRQMLNEAGINKNTLKDIAKEVLQEEIGKAINQALNEANTADEISRKVKACVEKSGQNIVRDEIRNRVYSIFNRMTISVDITDKDSQSIVTKN